EELAGNPSIQSVDLLSRFLSSGHPDENFVIDIIISFIVAGRDTISAAFVWFFWLLSKNPAIETEIVNEIKEKSDSPIYDEVKDMVYIHASLCESMRLYPPVPVNARMANADDVLPDGTVVKKGVMVSYHPYAMGRVEKVWGKYWSEFRPERWLEKDEKSEKLRFTARDPYTYPVFHAGPMVCLGKEMAILQMKRVVAGVLQRCIVVPVAKDGGEPVYVAALTSKRLVPGED
ncbi:cytochrome P450, partial [Cynara cardunculus var. scolymus]